MRHWRTFTREGDLYEPGDMEPACDTERRADIRHVTVMRVAILRFERGDELCLVRNISEGGLKARIWSTIPAGTALTAEFKSGHHIAGTVIWSRDNHIGIQFRETGDLTTLLGADDIPVRGSHPRAPRVQIETPARVRVGSRFHRVMLHDISQSGAKISLEPPHGWDERDQPLALIMSHLPDIDGAVRWYDRETAGIAFNTPIALDTLAGWIAAQRS